MLTPKVILVLAFDGEHESIRDKQGNFWSEMRIPASG